MRTFRNYYFKDQDPSRPLMSGIALPKSDDGVVRDVTFVGCSFHPNCSQVQFVDCTFTDCDAPTKLWK